MPRPEIEKAWARASDQDRAFGAAAYQSYHDTLRVFAKTFGTGFIPTVEAFVAMSPNNDYHGNLRSLSSVLYAHHEGLPLDKITISTYKACAYRAIGYLEGERSFLDEVQGQKITSFRHNILYLEASNRVTVDGHMIGLWHGEPLTMKQAAAKMKSPKVYAELEQDFVLVARKHKVAPCVLQATLWALQKRERGVKYSAQADLFSGVSRWLGTAHPKDYPPYIDKREWALWLQGQKGKTHVQAA